MRALKLIVGAALAFGFPSLGEAGARVPIQQKITVIDQATGRPEKFPGGSGYSYEVLQMLDGQAVVRIYNPIGKPIEGKFLVEETAVPANFKAELTAGLKAATGGGPRGEKNGCCEVIDDPQEPSKANRSPAIAPGARIVYAEPKPLPKLVPLPPARVIASKQPPLCGAFNQFKAKGVPAEPLRQALYFLSKRSNASTQRYVAIADYSQNSRKKRFYLLDLRTGSVTQEKTSHGGGTLRNGRRGDPNHDGMLNACGGSKSGMTRAGFFQTGGYYMSSSGRYKWPLVSRRPPRNGVKLKGLTPGVNDDVEKDGVVMHEQYYNRGGNQVMGRSWGCPAFVPGQGAPLFAKMVSDSALLYSYAPVCKAQMGKVLRQVDGWENFCK